MANTCTGSYILEPFISSYDLYKKANHVSRITPQAVWTEVCGSFFDIPPVVTIPLDNIHLFKRVLTDITTKYSSSGLVCLEN